MVFQVLLETIGKVLLLDTDGKHDRSEADLTLEVDNPGDDETLTGITLYLDGGYKGFFRMFDDDARFPKGGTLLIELKLMPFNAVSIVHAHIRKP